MRILRAVLAALFLLSLTGCTLRTGSVEHLAVPEGDDDYRVTLATVPAIVVPGEQARLQMIVARADGHPADLEMMHERLMHVMLIRDDLRHFAHIHAEDSGTIDLARGKFELMHVFPAPGRYRVMVEFTERGRTVAMPKDVIVTGSYVPVPLGEESRTSTVGDYAITLHAPEKISYGSMVMLSFDVAKNGVPVHDLDKFLGEDMHLAIWQEGLMHFEHAHPMMMDGQMMFHVAFPTPGTYKLYPQFQHQGKVITAEFLLKVA